MHEPIFFPPQRAQVLSIKGGYKGLTAVFDSQTLIRATRNGLYYECRRIAERMLGGSLGNTVLRCVGGHTRNPSELQIKSDIMGISMEVLKEKEISSKGVFLIAATSLKFFSDMKHAASGIYENMEKQFIHPDPEQKSLHEEVYVQSYLSCFSDGIYSL
jgi:glycerol kinase